MDTYTTYNISDTELLNESNESLKDDPLTLIFICGVLLCIMITCCVLIEFLRAKQTKNHLGMEDQASNTAITRMADLHSSSVHYRNQDNV